MAATVTPQAGAASVVTTGGTPVVAVVANPSGGFITNPQTAADQGNTDPDAFPEPLYVDPVTAAGLQANGTTFAIPPGGSWPLIPGQTTPTSVNAQTDGHKFSVVFWP